MLGAISALYSVCKFVLYPVYSDGHLLGPTWSAVGLALLAYAAHFFMALLIYRYLSRLRPFEIILQDGAAQLHPINTLEFWIPLAVVLMYINLGLLFVSWIPTPTFVFDITLLTLFWRRFSFHGPSCLGSGAPIALFLRPFASFSDRSLLGAILNALPSSTQVVFLVPRSEPFSVRDPLSLGLAGMNLGNLLRSVPIALVASNQEWEACVLFLIQKSNFIFMDTSRMTASMEKEIGLIQESDACSRTLILIDSAAIEAAAEIDGDSRFQLGEQAEWRAHMGWSKTIIFKKKNQPVRSGLALGIILFSVIGIYLDVTDRFILPGLALELLGYAVIFLAVSYWMAVFVKKGVSSLIVKEIQIALHAPLTPVWRRKALGVAGLLFVFGLGLRHGLAVSVLVGQEFPVHAVVNVIGRDNLVVLQTPSIDSAKINASAAWIINPGGTLRIDRQQVKNTYIFWNQNEGFRLADAIQIRLDGVAKINETALAIQPSLWLVLRDILDNDNAIQPRLVAGPIPQAGLGRGKSLFFEIDSWNVHKNRLSQLLGILRWAGALLLMSFLPAAIVTIGWKLLRI